MSGRKTVLPIETALQCIQEIPAFIVPDGQMGLDVWSPWQPLPAGVLRSVYAHRELVLAKLLEGEASVCASPTLHRQEWVLVDDKLICRLCHTFVRLGVC
jgi:hypothetical protein